MSQAMEHMHGESAKKEPMAHESKAEHHSKKHHAKHKVMKKK